MGKITTPTYRIEVSCISFLNKRREIHSFAWDCSKEGRPTSANIQKWIAGFNKSLEIGGSNQHLNGTQSPYNNGTIYRQKTGTKVAEYIAPKFQVIN